MPGPAAGREQAFSILTGGQLASAVLHLPAGGGPHPAVLCLHGLAGVKSFYIALARRLAEAGVACLRLDFRGCGDSSGSLEDLTLETQMEDAEAAFKALRGRPDIRYDGIGLLGFSMGGGVASLMAHRLEPRCLGLWAPLLKLSKYVSRSSPAWTPLEGGRMLLWEGHVAGPGLFESCERHQPLPQAEAYPGPLLLAHGEADQSVPAADSRQLQAAREAAGLPVEAHYYPASGHLFEAPAERALLYQVTTVFFTRALLGSHAPQDQGLREP
jgi:dienelactone hydrolase